jgi:hypothetical protein
MTENRDSPELPVIDHSHCDLGADNADTCLETDRCGDCPHYSKPATDE